MCIRNVNATRERARERKIICRTENHFFFFFDIEREPKKTRTIEREHERSIYTEGVVLCTKYAVH